MKRAFSALAAVAVLILLWRVPATHWLAGGLDGLRSLGMWGPAAAAGLYAALTVAMVPASVLSLAIAASFGFWTGLATVVAGANAGALGAFLLSRTLFRRRAQALAARHPKFAALDAAVGRSGFRIVFLLRLSPLVPFTVLNALLGLTTVRTGAYIFADLAGMLPGTVMYVAAGSACADCLAAPALHWGKLAVQAAGVAATIFVTVMLSRTAQRALDAETGGA